MRERKKKVKKNTHPPIQPEKDHILRLFPSPFPSPLLSRYLWRIIPIKMIKVGRSLSQLVDSKRTRESGESRRGGSVVNPQRSFFPFEKQGIRKSFKGDRTDSYQGPKLSHISITPKSAVTIQPPKKVGFFFSSFFLSFSFPSFHFLARR